MHAHARRLLEGDGNVRCRIAANSDIERDCACERPYRFRVTIPLRSIGLTNVIPFVHALGVGTVGVFKQFKLSWFLFSVLVLGAAIHSWSTVS